METLIYLHFLADYLEIDLKLAYLDGNLGNENFSLRSETANLFFCLVS